MQGPEDREKPQELTQVSSLVPVSRSRSWKGPWTLMRLTLQDIKSLRPRELSGEEVVVIREQRKDAGLS